MKRYSLLRLATPAMCWLTRVMFAASMIASSGCGTKNLGSCPGTNPLVKCTPLSTDEAIRVALDNGDLAEARRLLEDAIATEPENYNRYPLLGSVYAGLAGFDLVSAISSGAGTSGGSSGSSSINTILSAFLPDPAAFSRDEYTDRITLMGLAVTTLQSLPAEFLATADSDKFASSASTQLPVYLAAQASMSMTLFTFDFNNGVADSSQLAAMTADDADSIIAMLESAAAGGGAFGDIATAALDAINAGGGNNKDNLANFLGNS